MSGYQTGANSFALDLSRFAAKAAANMQNVIRKIAFEGFKRIILRTPVDTGRARANWGVTIGKPGTSHVEGEDKSGGATVNAALASVNSFDCNGSIFCTNNLAYIIPLEYGSSKQAPQGMVRITVEELTGFVAKAAASDIRTRPQ